MRILFIYVRRVLSNGFFFFAATAKKLWKIKTVTDSGVIKEKWLFLVEFTRPSDGFVIFESSKYFPLQKKAHSIVFLNWVLRCYSSCRQTRFSVGLLSFYVSCLVEPLCQQSKCIKYKRRRVCSVLNMCAYMCYVCKYRFRLS